MSHGVFFKKLLHKGSSYFGVLCFVASLILGIDSKYIAAVTYFAALLSFYFAAYGVWSDEFKKNSGTYGVKILSGSATFSSGTGRTFHNSAIMIKSQFYNSTLKTVSFTDFVVKGELDSDKVKLKKSLRLADTKYDVGLNLVTLKPGKSIMVSLITELNSTLFLELETASYLKEFDLKEICITYNTIVDGVSERQERTCSISMQSLKDRFTTEWGQRGLLAEIKILA